MQPTGKYDKIKPGDTPKQLNDRIPKAQLLYEPTSYNACSETGVKFSEMLALSINGPSGGMPMDELAINTQYFFGDTRYTLSEKGYEISLRSARVVLDLFNAEIIAGSHYILELPPHEFMEKKVAVKEAGAKANASVDGKLGFVASVLSLPLSPKAEASASIERKKNTKSNEETVTETSRTYKIFCPCGVGIWRIGGDHGDPRQNSKDLRDPMSAEPLCIMKAQDFGFDVTGILSVQAAKTDFVINEVDGDRKANSFSHSIRSLNYNISDQKILQSIDREQENRRRMAAIAAIKNDIDVCDQVFDGNQTCNMRLLHGRSVLASAKFSFKTNNGGERV